MQCLPYAQKNLPSAAAGGGGSGGGCSTVQTPLHAQKNLPSAAGGGRGSDEGCSTLWCGDFNNHLPNECGIVGNPDTKPTVGGENLINFVKQENLEILNKSFFSAECLSILQKILVSRQEC